MLICFKEIFILMKNSTDEYFSSNKSFIFFKFHNLEMDNKEHSFLCREGLLLVTQAYHIQYTVSKFTLGELNKVFSIKTGKDWGNKSLQFTAWREQLQTGNTGGPWSLVVFVQSFPFNSYSPFFMTLLMDSQENTALWEGIWQKKRNIESVQDQQFCLQVYSWNSEVDFLKGIHIFNRYRSFPLIY